MKLRRLRLVSLYQAVKPANSRVYSFWSCSPFLNITCNLQIHWATEYVIQNPSYRLQQQVPVEPVCVFCCRRLPWQRKDVYSAAGEYVGAMTVSHPWLQSTHRDPPDDIDMESWSDRNTPPSQGEDHSTADELQTQPDNSKKVDKFRKSCMAL